ncbi:hypothetical protein [Glutamicibacter sp.]|uniref:hypothetical protein n=1 Tax=Glutamicibacter sp. TaxID=1931995 RepID=UPI0028BD4FCC|nr:hypothetical protein [Glutamicibacter sp.]
MRNLIDDMTTLNAAGKEVFAVRSEARNTGTQETAMWPWLGSADLYEPMTA